MMGFHTEEPHSLKRQPLHKKAMLKGLCRYGRALSWIYAQKNIQKLVESSEGEIMYSNVVKLIYLIKKPVVNRGKFKIPEFVGNTSKQARTREIATQYEEVKRNWFEIVNLSRE